MGNEVNFFWLVVILFLLLPFLVQAQIIRINIAQVLDIETSNLSHQKIIKNGEPFNVSFDVYNPGSVGYSARIRLDVLKNDDSIFVGWSNEQPLWPNSYAHYELFWYPVNSSENLNAKIRIYYANEILEFKPIKFEIKTYPSPSNPFKITSFKTYEDRVKIGLISDKDLKDVIIIPSDYPLGWIFEQTKVDNLSANKEKQIELRYIPSIWRPIEVKINIVAENGKYFSSETLSMKRETNTFSYISYVMKSILIMLRIYP